MSDMTTPRTRAEFERNLHLLHRKIADGKLSFAQGLSHAIDGIARVRFLPNGRIDLLSIDESARLQANMMNQFNEESLQAQAKEDAVAADVSTSAKDSDSPSVGSGSPSDLVG